MFFLLFGQGFVVRYLLDRDKEGKEEDRKRVRGMRKSGLKGHKRRVTKWQRETEKKKEG